MQWELERRCQEEFFGTVVKEASDRIKNTIRLSVG